jgi:hypothetical protein
MDSAVAYSAESAGWRNNELPAVVDEGADEPDLTQRTGGLGRGGAAPLGIGVSGFDQTGEDGLHYGIKADLLCGLSKGCFHD